MSTFKKLMLFFTFSLLLLLPACGSRAGTESIEPSPSPTATPSPTPTPSAEYKIGKFILHADDTSLDLRGISHEEIKKVSEVLPEFNDLKTIELGNDEESPVDWEDIALLEASAPSAAVSYSFTLYDLPFTLADAEMDLNHIDIDDRGELVRKVIACMPNLTYLDMDFCGVEDEDMAAIRDDFPNIEVVWRVFFGEAYTCRTDVEKILASCPGLGGNLTPENTQSLKYCTKVKYLDVGHNEVLHDISFISYMPDLEVAILAMDYFTDTSPLADCPHLEFLEIQTNEITDLTPLSGLKELKHLNIGWNFELTDISPIYDLDLERLWIGCLTPIPDEQVEEFKRRHPDCEVNTEVYDPHGDWRYASDGSGFLPRYALLVEQFGYDKADYALAGNDPKFYKGGVFPWAYGS